MTLDCVFLRGNDQSRPSTCTRYGRNRELWSMWGKYLGPRGPAINVQYPMSFASPTHQKTSPSCSHPSPSESCHPKGLVSLVNPISSQSSFESLSASHMVTRIVFYVRLPSAPIHPRP